MDNRKSHRGLRERVTSASEMGTKLFESAISVVRLAVESRRPALPYPNISRGRILVLGTGPSLKDSLRELIQLPYEGLSFISVNDYFKDDSFATLKPAFHAIADPIYWDQECFDDYGRPLVESIAGAAWRPLLFLPRRAHGSTLHKSVQSSGINFAFYNTTPIKGLRVLEDFAFWRMLGMPRPQNVLVAAIAISLWLNFKSVALIGADHSWHQEIEVAPDNVLLVRQSHSYDKQHETRPFYKPVGVSKLSKKRPLTRDDMFSVKEIFLAWAAMHESYEQLDAIAMRRQATIVNSSAFSFIDAFKRVTLAEFIST